MPLDKITLFDEKSLNHISRPFRNLIINGGMHIHQKGINKTNITSSGIYTADKWILDLKSIGSWDNIIEDNGPLNTGINKSFKIICTKKTDVLSDSYAILQQEIESRNLQILKKGTDFAENFTLSFWVKSNTIGKYIIDIIDINNKRSISASYLINQANVWERKTITFLGDKIGLLNNDTRVGLTLNFWLMAGQNYTNGKLNTNWDNTYDENRAVGQINLAEKENNYFQITGVQMEIGAVATNFEMLPYNLQTIINSSIFDGNLKTNADLPLTFSTNNTERLRIDGMGNINMDSGLLYLDAINNRIGINTITPTHQLQVNGIINTSGLLIDDLTTTKDFVGLTIINRKNTGSVISYIDSIGRTSAIDSAIFFQHNADNSSEISLYTQNAGAGTDRRQERLRINKTGNLIIQNDVGIGEANPGSRLHITDISSPPIANRHMLYLGTTVGWSSITHNLGNGSYNPISINGDIGLIFSKSAINTGSMIIAPWSDNQTGIRITPTAVNIFNANGIKFSPTQVPSTDVNTLDDYEEGGWTPVVTSPASGVTVSAIYNAQYTKIGRQVTAMTHFQLNNTSGVAQTNVNIGGLPFACQGVYGFVSGYYGTSNNMKNIAATTYIEVGTTFFYLFNLNLPTGTSLHMYYISYFTN